MMSGLIRPIDDELIQKMDPLGMDALIPELWLLNASKDINGLISISREVLSRRSIRTFSARECLAVMRDLGLLLGSIKRCGVEPVDVVENLEGVLLEIGRRTDMIPRDTVHHQARWNPTGRRERLYTGDPQERMLILSVRLALPQVNRAVRLCESLRVLDPVDIEFAAAAAELVHLLGSMNDAIENVISTVPPSYFASCFRPYVEDVRVGGQRYLGPAAAHLPLGLVDLALWAGDRAKGEYRNFIMEGRPYARPEFRGRYDAWSSGPSILTTLEESLSRADMERDNYALHASTDAIRNALKVLRAFRGKHLMIARKAYRSDTSDYAQGSGGGTVQLLEDIVAQTTTGAQSLTSASRSLPHDILRANEANNAD